MMLALCTQADTAMTAWFEPACKRAAARWRRQHRAAQTGGGGANERHRLRRPRPPQFELPTIRPMPGSWARQAACIPHPLHWWFPEHSKRTVEVLQALDICNACPVQPECLQHALRHNETYGIWGGRSERARARMRRATRGAA